MLATLPPWVQVGKFEAPRLVATVAVLAHERAATLIEAADVLPMIGAISLDLQLGVGHWARAQLST